MNGDRWIELKDTFAALIELAPHERSDQLSALGASDPELHQRLAALLEADARADSLLSRLELVTPPDEDSFDADDGTVGVARDPFGFSGRTVSHFRVLDVIGAGGMGVVYRAEDERLARTVALKLPLPQYASDQQAKERFLNEARAASALDHPNVCTVYEAGETEEGHPFMAMAWYAGETLKTRLARVGPLPLNEAENIARALLRALDAAHAAGVVHRDLKPGNVMLGTDGSVKILDFGLAKVRDLSVIGSGHRAGTTPYMSPEQLEGGAVDGRTDLWSLGVVLYEMLTGTRPFGAGHGLSTVYAVLHEDPKPPSQIRPEVPHAYDAIVDKLLRKNPEDRFANAESALAELGRISLPDRPRDDKRSESRLTWRALSLAIVVVVAIGAVVAATKAGRTASEVATDRQIASIAVIPPPTSGDTADEHFVDGLTDDLITALGKVRGLQVKGRTSAFNLRNRGLTVRAIGDTLDVATVLELSVRRAAASITVIASLARASDSKILWSRTFDQQPAAVFTVQEEIARAVAGALKLPASRGATGNAVNPTHDLVAYEHYLKGKHHWFLRGREHLDSAVTYFRRATERDTGFALAYAGLADAYVNSTNFGFKPFRETLSLAEVAADRAIALDPSLSEAHSAKGFVHASRESFEASEASFLRAVELNPSDLWAHHFYSLLLTMEKRTEEAARENSLAVHIDPFAAPPNSHVGVMLLLRGDRASARRAFRQALPLNPEYGVTLYYLGVLDNADGNYPEALTMLERAHTNGARFPGVRSALAYTYKQLGRTADADAMMATLRADGKDDRARIDRALGEAVMGDVDRAYATLEHARWDVPSTINLRVNPLLAAFRKDPKYPVLLSEMGLKP